MYLIYGTSLIEIEEKIKEIAEKNNISNITKFSFLDNSIEEVITDACYFDMFSEKKCIVYEDALFLSSKSNEEVDELLKYINNPNENTILIFTLNEEKLDERKKIVKELKKKCEVFVYNSKETGNLTKIIDDNLKKEGFKIEIDALKELLERTKNNRSVILNEIEKLKCYKLDTKVISISDVKDIVSKPIEDDIFKLVNAIQNGDKKEIFSVYNDLIKARKEPAAIVGLLASQFRLYLSLKILMDENLNKYEIMEFFKGEHPYRIEVCMRETLKFKKKDLMAYLERLYIIDRNIKLGENAKEMSLEMFFLEM